VSLAALLERRLLIFSGKGGVGKSTVTAAFAVAAARRGRRVVIVEIGEHEKISRIFDTPVVGYVGGVVYRPGRSGAPPITSMCITAPEALREYAMRSVRFEMIYNAVFDNPVVRYFTAAAPGLEELNLLGKIQSMHREVIEPAPNARFDLMLLDAPATGHALAFFQAPQMAMRMAPAGPIQALLEPMWSLITDPVRTALNIVTLPEEMPVNESIELDAGLTALGIPRGIVIVNAVYPDAFPGGEAELASVHPSTAVGERVLAAAKSTLRHRRDQQSLVARLDAIPSPRLELPLVISPRIGPEDVEALADRIERALDDD
jgi:anion-transporting  ArsA/GET3 family ATPase